MFQALFQSRESDPEVGGDPHHPPAAVHLSPVPGGGGGMATHLCKEVARLLRVLELYTDQVQLQN